MVFISTSHAQPISATPSHHGSPKVHQFMPPNCPAPVNQPLRHDCLMTANDVQPHTLSTCLSTSCLAKKESPQTAPPTSSRVGPPPELAHDAWDPRAFFTGSSSWRSPESRSFRSVQWRFTCSRSPEAGSSWTPKTCRLQCLN